MASIGRDQTGSPVPKRTRLGPEHLDKGEKVDAPEMSNIQKVFDDLDADLEDCTEDEEEKE